MAPETSNRRESEEQSIKARKNELFEEEARPSGPSGPRKPAEVYLRQTPAMPLSPGVKATLWAVGVLVLLLFLAALLTRGARPPRPRAGGPRSSIEPRVEARPRLPLRS